MVCETSRHAFCSSIWRSEGCVIQTRFDFAGRLRLQWQANRYQALSWRLGQSTLQLHTFVPEVVKTRAFIMVRCSHTSTMRKRVGRGTASQPDKLTVKPTHLRIVKLTHSLAHPEAHPLTFASLNPLACASCLYWR